MLVVLFDSVTQSLLLYEKSLCDDRHTVFFIDWNFVFDYWSLGRMGDKLVVITILSRLDVT